MADFQRRMPRRQQRQVILVEVGDRLGVVGFELGLRDLVHPGPYDFTEDLPTRLAPDGLGDHSYGVLRFDEAEGHRDSGLMDADAAEGRRWRGRKGVTAPELGGTGPGRSGSTRAGPERARRQAGRRGGEARRAPSYRSPGPAPRAGASMPAPGRRRGARAASD